MGLPATLLNPWRDFLADMTRRFVVRQEVSEPVKSCMGFPEGCPLSSLAMHLADMAYHCYMQFFSPQVRCLTFVDNWGCMSHSLAGIASGLSATSCFAEMLDVQLDDDKTYLWVNQAAQKPALKCLGAKILTEARELGGTMSFGGVTRNKSLVARCQALDPLWIALRRSSASVGQKWRILPINFWSKALHGISACPLGAHHIHHLHTAATTALQIRPGGSSLLLRRAKLATRLPNFGQLWRTFMVRFDGTFYHGPCSKLLQVINELHWQVLEPPLFQDHDGLQHNLLACPLGLLRRLAEQAWLRHVARQHAHRASMSSLNGLDLGLLKANVPRLNALDNACLSALRSGVFT